MFLLIAWFYPTKLTGLAESNCCLLTARLWLDGWSVCCWQISSDGSVNEKSSFRPCTATQNCRRSVCLFQGR